MAVSTLCHATLCYGALWKAIPCGDGYLKETAMQHSTPQHAMARHNATLDMAESIVQHTCTGIWYVLYVLRVYGVYYGVVPTVGGICQEQWRFHTRLGKVCSGDGLHLCAV